MFQYNPLTKKKMKHEKKKIQRNEAFVYWESHHQAAALAG